MIWKICFVFLYIFWLSRISRKMAKICNRTQKFRHFFHFDAAFLMMHTCNVKCKNMNKKRRFIRFELYILIYCVSFDCRESAEKVQKFATGHKNFAIFFTLMQLFSWSIKSNLNLKTWTKRGDLNNLNCIFGFIVCLLTIENQAKNGKNLQPDTKISPFFSLWCCFSHDP